MGVDLSKTGAPVNVGPEVDVGTEENPPSDVGIKVGADEEPEIGVVGAPEERG